MHMLYVQLLDSSKASKTLAFAILARGLSFESGKLTRIIHIAWYRSADPANTGSSGYQQRCQVSVADFEGTWWWPCNRNLCSKSNTSLTFEFLWHCMFHLEVVQRCSLLNIFSSITRACTRGGCFLHDSDMATWRWTSFKSRRI